jgi:DNA mismatch repair ATPase MutS
MPRTVIHRAEELLSHFEGNESEPRPQRTNGKNHGRNGQQAANGLEQGNMFSLVATEEHPVMAEIRALKVMELNPLEALNKLYELQQKISKSPEV